MKKEFKIFLSLFLLFFLIFVFSSGEDVSWLGIVVNSLLYGLCMSGVFFVIYILIKGLINIMVNALADK